MIQQPQGLDDSQPAAPVRDEPEPLAAVPPQDETPRDKNKNKKDKDKKKKKKQERSRGTETMFRVTYQNHVSLSRLADNKANMLININSLIISVIIALVIPRLAALSWVVAPVVVLVGGCVVSLALAVLCAKPSLRRARITSEQVRSGAGNVLFFASFTTMPLAEFQDSLRALMKDRKLLYEQMARQLYEMGQSINKKYRYLQYAYTAFLLGVVLGAAAFVLVLLGGPLAA